MTYEAVPMTATRNWYHASRVMNASSANGVVLWRRFNDDTKTERATMRLTWWILVVMGRMYSVTHRSWGSAKYTSRSSLRLITTDARPSSGPKAMEANPW